MRPRDVASPKGGGPSGRVARRDRPPAKDLIGSPFRAHVREVRPECREQPRREGSIVGDHLVASNPLPLGPLKPVGQLANDIRFTVRVQMLRERVGKKIAAAFAERLRSTGGAP